MGQVKIFPVGPSGLVSRPVQLPHPQRHNIETRLNADLSNLNFHEGLEATQLNTNVFRHGNDVYFAPGVLESGGDLAEQLVVHELGHIWQQQLDSPKRDLAAGLVEVADSAPAESAAEGSSA
jgi:hypothetical protein